MMYGIIDVGSNSVRLNIYKNVEGRLSLVFSKKEAVGLASYVKNGQMMPEGINRACEVLSDYRLLLQDLSVENVHVFATAALRNAKNSRTAVDEIRDRTGMEIKVISGVLEAELDFVGVSHAVEVSRGLLVDIGGGSTELVVYEDGKIQKKVSIPIGSLNTYDRYVSNLLPDRAERKTIRQVVLEALKQDADLNYGSYPIICGIGGTIRAANRLNNYLFQLPYSNNRIKAPNIKKMIKLLEKDEGDSIPVDTLDVLLKVVPDRVRTVLPGMIILHTLIKHFRSGWIEVTKAGIRDGYLYRYVLNQDAPQEKEAEVHDQPADEAAKTRI